MLLLGALLALPLLSAAQTRPRRRDETQAAGDKYIIEVLPSDVEAVAAILEAKTGTKVLKTFTSEAFAGFSVQSDTDNVDTLLAIEKVNSAWVSRVYSVPEPIGKTEWVSDDAATTNYSVHQSTGVDLLHAEGITGKGAIIAIVDTGVDYSHPALGGCFGPGCRVIGGYDLAGDSTSDIVPDDDPMDYAGHGSHVAGIAAGSDGWFKGVAPDATILAYKVLSGWGNIEESALLEAFLMAYHDGADVITCSIGSQDGFSDGAWATLSSRLVDLGVVVTIAAGNEGVAGSFYASSGSSGKNVLAIASMNSNTTWARGFEATFNLDGYSNTSTLAFNPGVMYQDLWNRTVVLINNGETSAEACEPLPLGLPYLGDKVVLLGEDGCSLDTKALNLLDAGADFILFYSQEFGLARPSTSVWIQSSVIEARGAEAIIKTIHAGGNVVANFNMTTVREQTVTGIDVTGGTASWFSSYGGLYDLQIKPDIAAPGYKIWSVQRSSGGGGYVSATGTSMATPYVAGVAALYISKYGGRSTNGVGFAKDLVTKIIASGKSLPWAVNETATGWPINYGYFAPISQVGTGLIDAWKVLHYKTTLEFEKFALNDTRHFSRYHSVSVTNDHDVPVTYSFAVEAAGGYENQRPGFSSQLAYGPELKPVTIVPEVTLPTSGLTLKAGETKTFKVNFKPPTYYDESKLPLYSGKIIINSTQAESLAVPYMGVAFDLKGQMDEIFTESTPYQRSGELLEDIDTYNTYALNWTARDFPTIWAKFRWGSHEIRWDIFNAGWTERQWTWPPVPGQNGYVGSATYNLDVFVREWRDEIYYYPSGIDPKVVAPFPIQLPRTSNSVWPIYSFWFSGQLADGSIIPPGNYTMRFAALRPFGIQGRSDNWDIWETPDITIKAA